jgi:hypothetical protein
MFKFDPHPLFSADCVCLTPTLEGIVREEFKAVFEAVSIDEFNSYDMADEQGVREFLTATLRGVSDVVDPLTEVPLAYDAVLRDRLINTAHVRQALVRGYIGALRGN